MAWGFKRTLTLDHTKCGSANSTDWPFLFSGTYSYLKTVANGGNVTNANGYDIAFYSDSALTTPLFWEIETYDATTGAVNIWVKIPTLSFTVDTVIYLVYGDASITTFQSTASSVWDANYKLVCHAPNGSTLALLDSTTHANNGTNHSATATAGSVDGAIALSGSSQYVDYGNDASIEIASYDTSHTSPLTIELWMCYTGVIGVGQFPRAVSNFLFTPSFNGYEIVVREQTGGSPRSREIYFQCGQGGSLSSALSGVTLVQNTVYHVVATFDPGVTPFFVATSNIYINNTGSAGTVPFNGIGIGGNVFAGARPGPNDFWQGWIDELRISNVKRSSSWVTASYSSQNSPSTFYAVGSAITPSQTVTLGAAVIGPRAIGTPSVTGGNLVVHLAAAVGPRRLVYSPKVAGPIKLASAVIGPRAVPTPTVKLAQTITLVAAVIGPRAIPTARVANVQTLHPASAVIGPRAIPSPTVTGGPQFVNVFGGVKGPRRVYVPVVDGGTLKLTLYLSRVAVPISFVTECTVQSQTIGRWRCSFGLEVAGGVAEYQPQIGQTVLIVDHGYRVFAGCITEVTTERLFGGPRRVKYFCVAVDKSGICDHRVVPGTTYPAGADVAATIVGITTAFLNGEGITTGGVPTDGSLGTLPSDLPLNFGTVTQAFDAIAQMTGTVWWVNVDGILYFSPLVDLPAAPFSITETSGNWRPPGGAFGMSVRQTTTDYYNKLYAVSNLNIIPGSQGGGGTGLGNTETFVWTVGSPGIQPLTLADGSVVPGAIITSTPISSISSLTVDGVAQTTVDFGAFAGQVPAPPDLLWYWAGPATGTPYNVVTPTTLPTLPTPGQTIEITYVPYIASSSSVAQYGTALAPLNPHGDPLGTCGSGIYEGVIQVQNINSQDDLNAIAQAELDRIGGIPTVINFQTDNPGLAPGQKLTVNVPLCGANNLTTLITSVSGSFVAPGPFPATGASFRWDVECRTNLDPGNAYKWWERLINRTQNPLPVLQSDPINFALGAGSSLSSGVPAVNPYIVGRTGQLVQLYAAAQTPPTGQNLVLTLMRNGIAAGSVTIPATATANQLFVVTLGAADAQWFFKEDVVTIEAAYQVVGGSPTKAANVTFKALLSV